ncbi:hypothetical protein NEIPOLOT_01906 [Neisseria polysaccharea ATCC 43768]|nr:hypothetical protein NEIPOLOT_01906 [Neisseria polysaccharea ATCC 43768]
MFRNKRFSVLNTGCPNLLQTAFKIRRTTLSSRNRTNFDIGQC